MNNNRGNLDSRIRCKKSHLIISLHYLFPRKRGTLKCQRNCKTRKWRGLFFQTRGSFQVCIMQYWYRRRVNPSTVGNPLPRGSNNGNILRPRNHLKRYRRKVENCLPFRLNMYNYNSGFFWNNDEVFARRQRTYLRKSKGGQFRQNNAGVTISKGSKKTGFNSRQCCPGFHKSRHCIRKR